MSVCQSTQLAHWLQPLDGMHCHVKKKKKKKGIMETLTECKQLMLPVEQQLVTLWSGCKGRPRS